MARDEVLEVLQEFAGANSQQLNRKDLSAAINNLSREAV